MHFIVQTRLTLRSEKQDKRLKKKKIPKKERPAAPPKNDKYPTKLESALGLLEDFKHCHPTFFVTLILADAYVRNCKFYG